eukprot:6455438-Amphidinium_carterae.1
MGKMVPSFVRTLLLCPERHWHALFCGNTQSLMMVYGSCCLEPDVQVRHDVPCVQVAQEL